MTSAPFDRVQDVFAACLDRTDAERELILGDETEVVAAEVRELLGIADGDRRAGGDLATTDVLDANGRGLVLAARGGGVGPCALKLFRVRDELVDDCARVVATWSATVNTLEIASVVPVLGAGLHDRTAWVTTRLEDDTAPLPDACASAPFERRRALGRTLAEALVTAVARGLPAPWPAPRHVLVRADGSLAITDLGLTHRFADAPGPTPRIDPARALLDALGLGAELGDGADPAAFAAAVRN